jgi:rubrerythrin
MSDLNGIPLQQSVNPQSPVQPTKQQASPEQPQPVQQSIDPLLTDKVYDDDLDARWTSWKCLVCNFVYEGQVPKNQCPMCNNSDPDKFD